MHENLCFLHVTSFLILDAASSYRTTSQSSDIDDNSGSDKAVDGIHSTYSETIGGERDEWTGTFEKPGQLIRVMLFLPKGLLVNFIICYLKLAI